MNNVLVNILYVGAGSCLGGVCRYIVSRSLQGYAPGVFPWGTFVVNIVGCFLIGLIYGLTDRGCQIGEGWKLFLTVGFCGGFTTFSTFVNENYLLFSGGQHIWVAVYALASAAVGFLMLYFAYWLVRVLL